MLHRLQFCKSSFINAYSYCSLHYNRVILLSKQKGFLQADQKKIKILRAISDGKWHSYHRVHRKLGMNYNTTKKQLEFLETIGFVEIMRISKKDSASGVSHYSVRITEKGKEWLREIK